MFVQYTIFKIVCIYLGGTCVCHSAHGDVKGQLTGAKSPYNMGLVDQIQVLRPGGKCLYLLSHLDIPCKVSPFDIRPVLVC